MFEFQLSPLSLLQSSAGQQPLIYKFLSIHKSTPTIITLRDDRDSLECEVIAEAAANVACGVVKPGNVLSVTDFEYGNQGVIIKKIAKVASDAHTLIGFEELEAASENDNIEVVARVVSIGDMGSFQSKFGPRPYFNLALLDFRGQELIASFFSNEAEQFHKFCIEGRIYSFARFKVDLGCKKPTPRLRISITANLQSSIREVSHPLFFPTQSFDLQPFPSLYSLPANTILDLAGVIVSISDLTTSDRPNRRISLVNSNNQRAEVTLWGRLAQQNFSEYQGEMRVFVAKYVQKEKNGKGNVRTLEGLSRVFIDLRGLEEVERLMEWRNSRPREPGAYIPLQKSSNDSHRFPIPPSLSVSPAVLSLRDVKQDCITTGWDHKYTTQATVAKVIFDSIDDVMYASCPMSNCKKGVRMGEDGHFHCEKCDKSYPKCVYRYRLHLVLRDDEGEEVTATAFDTVGVEMLGVTVEEMRRLREELEEKLREVEGKSFTFKMKRSTRDLRSSNDFLIESAKAILRDASDIDSYK